MSVSHNTYLGPYFRCRTRTESITRNIVACPNRECREHGKPSPASVKFCPECGTALIRHFPVEVTVTRPYWDDVSEAIDEALQEVTTDDADFGDDYHLWIPNVTRPGQPERDADDRCGVEVPVDGLDIGGEKRWLVEAFNQELGILREMYGGADNVHIRWGLIKYCS